MTRAVSASGRGERGFSLLEVLIALLITIIGLAGALMMQASTTRSNRQNAEFTHASMIAEETLELARGYATSRLLQNNLTFTPQTHYGVDYAISLNAQMVSGQTNLVLITASVTYSEDNDTTAIDDRTASFQMIRTTTESL